jgi:hypothetical protein
MFGHFGTSAANWDSSDMQPPGSIVVLLQRPTVRLDTDIPQLHPPDAPWLLTARDDFTISAIRPTPAMHEMMPGREGLFYARRIAGGWDIIGPLQANDP